MQPPRYSGTVPRVARLTRVYCSIFISAVTQLQTIKHSLRLLFISQSRPHIQDIYKRKCTNHNSYIYRYTLKANGKGPTLQYASHLRISDHAAQRSLEVTGSLHFKIHDRLCAKALPAPS